MFNVSNIKSRLYGVVGIRQPLNPDYQIVDTDNQGSRSGLFVTDNPFAKVEYVYDNQDYTDLSDADFNTKLKEMQEESIVNVCNNVFNKSSYIDRQVLYSNANNKTELTTLPSGFVGYKIQVSKDKNVAFEISRIMLDFEGAGDIELLLFNTNQSEPLFSKVITISSTHQSEELNWVVDNGGDTYKGDYYLGYLTDGLTVQPYKRVYNNSSIQSIITHMCWNRMAVLGHNTNTLFDLSTQEGQSDDIGLNPDVTVFDDFSDLIIQNERLFYRAIYLSFQISFLTVYMASLRSNRNERESQLDLVKVIQQIEGQDGEGTVYVEGLRPQLVRELKALKSEIESIRNGYFGHGMMVTTLL